MTHKELFKFTRHQLMIENEQHFREVCLRLLLHKRLKENSLLKYLMLCIIHTSCSIEYIVYQLKKRKHFVNYDFKVIAYWLLFIVFYCQLNLVNIMGLNCRWEYKTRLGYLLWKKQHSFCRFNLYPNKNCDFFTNR